VLHVGASKSAQDVFGLCGAQPYGGCVVDHRVVVLGDQIPIDSAGESRCEMSVGRGVCGPVKPLAVDAFETRQEVESEQPAEGKRNDQRRLKDPAALTRHICY
jgi:hypothetical protein